MKIQDRKRKQHTNGKVTMSGVVELFEHDGTSYFREVFGHGHGDRVAERRLQQHAAQVLAL